MLAELGASNITDTDKSLLSDYSLESLVKADPDFIFLLPMGDSDEAAQKALKDQTTANPAWKELSAVKKGRVITLDPSCSSTNPTTTGMTRTRSCTRPSTRTNTSRSST